MDMKAGQAKVGIGVFVFKNGKFLMIRRQGAHGAGTWSVPGGHLEFGESPESCAAREVMEEVGIEIMNPRFVALTNEIYEEEGLHYITVWITSQWSGNIPAIKEPKKITEIDWRTFENLPSPLFKPWEGLLKSEFIQDLRARLQETAK